MHEALKLKKEQFNLRFQRASGPVARTPRACASCAAIIARVKTHRRAEDAPPRSKDGLRPCPSAVLQGVVISDKQEKTRRR